LRRGGTAGKLTVASRICRLFSEFRMTGPAWIPVGAWPVAVQGFALGLGLIVAIGAQNAFVLRQGLRREHVGRVVALC